MATRRQRKVSELVHRELSMLLMLEARDPRLSGVTITAVDVSPDLLLARVHFTVLGEPGEEDVALDALQHAAGFLRTELAARVQLRFVPELAFKVDKSMAYARRIDELLAQVHLGDGAGEGPVQSIEEDTDAGPEPA